MTSPRNRRNAKAGTRLDHLIRQARADTSTESSSLPADQPWLDVSLNHPDTMDRGWWADPGPAPPDDRMPSENDAAPTDDGPSPSVATPLPDLETDPISICGTDTPGEPVRIPQGTSPPTEPPWWRRQAGRLLERWLPDRVAERRRWRLAVAAVVGAVIVGVAVALGLATSSRGGEPETPPALPAAPGGSSAATASPPSEAGRSMVISVVGRVAKPGLVTLPDGARVADALKAVGGPVRGVDLGALNLARRLTDGEQIYVGIPTPPNAEPPGTASGTGQSGADVVDLNSASLAALDTLPGVGPVTAQRIVDWRTQHGRFASVDQLQDVDGIGPTRFARLKDLVVAR